MFSEELRWVGLSALCPVCRHLCGALVHGHMHMSVSDSPDSTGFRVWLSKEGACVRVCVCVCLPPRTPDCLSRG